MPQRWKQQVAAELAAPLASGDASIDIDVPARRASTARRRMHWISEYLRPHGYVFTAFDPTRRPATGRFGIANFRREP